MECRRGTLVVPAEVKWTIQSYAADLTSRSLRRADATSRSLRKAESEGHVYRARELAKLRPIFLFRASRYSLKKGDCVIHVPGVRQKGSCS